MSFADNIAVVLCAFVEILCVCCFVRNLLIVYLLVFRMSQNNDHLNISLNLNHPTEETGGQQELQEEPRRDFPSNLRENSVSTLCTHFEDGIRESSDSIHMAPDTASVAASSSSLPKSPRTPSEFGKL